MVWAEFPAVYSGRTNCILAGLGASSAGGGKFVDLDISFDVWAAALALIAALLLIDILVLHRVPKVPSRRVMRDGLSIILAFVGVKMILTFFDVHIEIWISLMVIALVMLASVGFSLRATREDTISIPEEMPPADER